MRDHPTYDSRLPLSTGDPDLPLLGRRSSSTIATDEAGVSRVVDVLWNAFRDYPVMRYVVGDAGADYDARLRVLVRMFVMARVVRGEHLLGITRHGEPGDGELEAAALVSRPDDRPTPTALEVLRQSVWDRLGSAARSRYEAFGAACAPLTVPEPHIHLNMIGVRDRARGTGLGRRLLEHVHALSRDDPRSQGVTLTTENAANVPLYQHFGYRLLGHADVGPGLETWGFFRPDDAELRSA